MSQSTTIKPLIAIAPASRNDDYIESVRRAGADPWLLDPSGDRPIDAVRDADAFMLLGGADVEPSRYGETPHPTFQASESDRDAYETELIEHAIELDIPLLAICRGIQILNVALGGSLIQDIPSQTSSLVPHAAEPDEPREKKAVIKHEVTVTSGTRLHAVLGPQLDARNVCAVNSRHHQAVKQLGRDLVVTAVAPDGIIEAIERPASSFCVGVQWHPENFVHEASYNFSALFRAFVRAAVQSQRHQQTYYPTAGRSSRLRPTT